MCCIQVVIVKKKKDGLNLIKCTVHYAKRDSVLDLIMVSSFQRETLKYNFLSFEWYSETQTMSEGISHFSVGILFLLGDI